MSLPWCRQHQKMVIENILLTTENSFNLHSFLSTWYKLSIQRYRFMKRYDVNLFMISYLILIWSYIAIFKVSFFFFSRLLIFQTNNKSSTSLHELKIFGKVLTRNAKQKSTKYKNFIFPIVMKNNKLVQCRQRKNEICNFVQHFIKTSEGNSKE